MRSKTILSIAAFIVAFAFSTAFAGLFIAKSGYQSVLTAAPANYDRQPNSCFKNRGRYTADKIEVFISQDDSNGREHQQISELIHNESRSSLKSPLFSRYSTVVAEYVETAENMDESMMPQEFQTAWRAHLKAWRNYADFLESMKSSSARAGLTEQEAYELESRFGADINPSFHEVTRISRDYGAEVY